MGSYQGRHALIIASAPETDYRHIEEILSEHPGSIIACADGGMRHAAAMGLAPDLIVGDFDSAEWIPERGEIIALKAEKDDTDTQSCLHALTDRGCKDITVVCATGGRIDHMLANLSLLEQARALGVSCRVADSQNLVVLHDGGCQHFKMPERFRYFSIMPLDRQLTGVTIRGAKYPLNRAVVCRREPISISNEAKEPCFSIEIEAGTALVIFTADRT